MQEPREYHYINLWEIPTELSQPSSKFTEEERLRAVNRFVKTSDTPFPPNSLASKAALTGWEEIQVVLALVVVMGFPLFWMFLATPLALVGSWMQCMVYVALTLVLALHPLPVSAQSGIAKFTRSTNFVRNLYKYFSYRFVWCDDVREEAMKMKSQGAFLGAGVPHGVLPFANLLSIPAINSYSFVGTFLGAPASVVFNTPFLRYLTILGTCDCGRESIRQELREGRSVGVVPDGIAGIFRCNEEDEVVYLKSRKGLAKLALQTGTPIYPSYSMGNTTAFSCYYDSFGIMEWLSRKAQASLFIYWGRYGLPIPHRTNISLLVSAPIKVGAKIDNPTQDQIDDVHNRLLTGFKTSFDLHKDALGWGAKQMRFE